MASIDKLLESIRENPANVRFADLIKVCRALFGEPRQSGSSHVVFKMPWVGDPRINLQNDKGKAKTYQVKQVLAAIEKMKKDRL